MYWELSTEEADVPEPGFGDMDGGVNSHGPRTSDRTSGGSPLLFGPPLLPVTERWSGRTPRVQAGASRRGTSLVRRAPGRTVTPSGRDT